MNCNVLRLLHHLGGFRHGGPLAIRLDDMAGNVLRPHGFDFAIEIQIQFASTTEKFSGEVTACSRGVTPYAQ